MIINDKGKNNTVKGDNCGRSCNFREVKEGPMRRQPLIKDLKGARSYENLRGGQMREWQHAWWVSEQQGDSVPGAEERKVIVM